jgi:hypothetical protein
VASRNPHESPDLQRPSRRGGGQPPGKDIVEATGPEGEHTPGAAGEAAAEEAAMEVMNEDDLSAGEEAAD